MSSQTIVYKGLMLLMQLVNFMKTYPKNLLLPRFVYSIKDFPQIPSQGGI